MSFKKDYINYLLYSVGQSFSFHDPEQARVKKVLDHIIATDDLVKAAFVIGKTAGLETLFKYLLYISDKIDKSQISISNLKDNFDYDMNNLRKICQRIQAYRSPVVIQKIGELEIAGQPPEHDAGEPAAMQTNQSELQTTDQGELEAPEIEAAAKDEEIISQPRDSDYEEEAQTDLDAEEDQVILEQPAELQVPPEGVPREEISEGQSELTLIETGSEDAAAEVFEHTPDFEELQDVKLEKEEESEDTSEKLPDSYSEGIHPEQEVLSAEKMDQELPVQNESVDLSPEAQSKPPEEPEIEIEIRTPDQRQEVLADEPLSNERYFKFETKFREEVKILEKIFLSIYNDTKAEQISKLTGRLRKGFRQAIEITDELSNLTRELSFDLTADIFLTINLFFKKALGVPTVVTPERLELLNSSLVLVRNLIEGANYLNYDTIVDKIEQLKNEMLKPAKQDQAAVGGKAHTDIGDMESKVPPESGVQSKQREGKIETKGEPIPAESTVTYTSREGSTGAYPQKSSPSESVRFKMRWIVKDFEKVFDSLSRLTGEYSKFEALERCEELINYLRLMAKLAHTVRAAEICRLAEVAYVFLKYVKDYRMDLLEPEIQQVVKYIIFSFKMLLMNRKPEDFEVLVEYLNNPVKIFTDS